MSKKTILFIYQYPDTSGTQNKLLDTIKDCLEKDYSCMALFPKKGDVSNHINELGVKTIFFPIGNYSPVNYALRFPILTLLLLDLLRKEHVDMVYVNGTDIARWIKISASLRMTALVGLK
ncbi:MAG: hypothetical protein ABH848_04450 [Candidatus Omnitrophota bacterium]